LVNSEGGDFVFGIVRKVVVSQASDVARSENYQPRHKLFATAF